MKPTTRANRHRCMTKTIGIYRDWQCTGIDRERKDCVRECAHSRILPVLFFYQSNLLQRLIVWALLLSRTVGNGGVRMARYHSEKREIYILESASR